MQIVKDLTGNYSDCIVTYFNFEEHASKHKNEDVALFVGYNSQFHKEVAQRMKEKHSSVIFFNGEQPCAYHQPLKLGNQSSDIDDRFTDIYTICPYTAKWNNDLYNGGEEKFKPILFPIDKTNLISEFDKQYDAIFYGSICGQDHIDIIDAISKFKYKFITLGTAHWYPNISNADLARVGGLVTDTNIHTFDKWKILSQTKIVPIYNQLYLHDSHIENIKKYDNWQQNEAWSHIDEKIAPQLKPRVTEGALFKMLMLVKRDPWNLIEYWYEPDKDFLYFDTNEELEEMIHEVSNNWEDYQHIIESAYKKAYENYTTEAILDRMLNNKREL